MGETLCQYRFAITILAGVLQVLHGHDMKNNSFISNERHLYEDLLKGYNRYVRPVRNENSTVDVTFSLSLVRIEELEEKSQTLHFHAWLKMSWTDEQLTWDPSDFGGITTLRIPAKHVWLPDIVLYNSALVPEEAGEFLTVVYSNGYLLFIPHMKLISTCPLDMTRFPYDSHDCNLKFGSWAYDGQLVNIVLDSTASAVDNTYYSEHSEWEVDNNIKTVRNEAKYPCCKETYPDVTITLSLKRKNTFYTSLFVTPAVVLAFLVPILFWLPPHSADKMNFGGCLLITDSVLLAMLESFIPSAHPTLPFVGVYYIAVFVLIALSLVFSVIVRNIWARHQWKARVPTLVRKIFLDGIGRLVCVRGDPYAAMDNQGGRPRTMEVMSDGDSLAETEVEDKSQIMASFARQATMAEWRQLAVVLDRLFFVLFLLVVCIISVALLH